MVLSLTGPLGCVQDEIGMSLPEGAMDAGQAKAADVHL